MASDLSAEADVLDSVFSSDRNRAADNPPAETDGQPRNERGQFAERTQQAEPPSPDKTAAPMQATDQQSAEQGENRTVPFATFEAERRKFRDREAKLKEDVEARFNSEISQLRQQLQQMRQPPQQQQPPPDFYQDPDGAIRHHMDKLNSQWRNQFLHQSERVARRTYGAQTVEAAIQAAERVGVVSQFVDGVDPWDDLVQWHKRQLALDRVGTDPDAFEKRVREEERQKVLAELKAGGAGNGQAPQQTRFPGSLASATPTGEQGATLTEDDMMSNVFGSNRRARQRR